MDANSGKSWSKMDIEDLRASLDFGNTLADAASMLCRDEHDDNPYYTGWRSRAAGVRGRAHPGVLNIHRRYRSDRL